MPEARASLADRTKPALGRALFYISFPFGFMGFILPVYGGALGASATAIGGLFSIFSAMTLVLRPAVGYALDRRGRRPFLLAGVCLYAATMLTFAIANGYTGLLAARALQGFASAAMWLAVYGMVSDISPPDRRGENYGTMQQRANAGGLYGAALGFLVLTLAQHAAGAPRSPAAMRAAFAVYFLVSLYALAHALRVPETRWAAAAGPAGPATTPDPAAGGNLFSPRYLGILGGVLLTSTGYGMLAPLMMIYLMDRTGASMVELGLAYLPAGLVWAALPERAGRIADRRGRRTLMITGLLTSAAVALSVPLCTSLWPLAVVWAAEAAALCLAIPAEQAVISDLTGAEVRGQAYGYYDAAYAVGFTLGPLLGGWLFDRVGHAAPFYADALSLLAAAGLIAAVLRGGATPAPLPRPGPPGRSPNG